MTLRKKTNFQFIGEIDPDRLYRTTLGLEIFGYGPQRIDDLIESGELPEPIPLSAKSKFKAWIGRQIISHRARMKELAAQQLEADRNRPAQVQPKALQPKIKKLKLRPPS